MKRLTLTVLLATLLGGCVVAPYGYRDSDDGHRYWRHDDDHRYYYDRGYYRSENTRRDWSDH
jgi:hypothetical protein